VVQPQLPHPCGLWLKCAKPLGFAAPREVARLHCCRSTQTVCKVLDLCSVLGIKVQLVALTQNEDRRYKSEEEPYANEA